MRFSKRNMILENPPSTPQSNTPYPRVLSAEYFQSILRNTFFNHRGYDLKPREAFGIALITFPSQARATWENAGGVGLDSTSENVENQRASVGAFHTQVDLSRTLDNLSTRLDPYDAVLSRAVTHRFIKLGGTSRFSAANSYSVQLCVDQFIGVDYDNPDPSRSSGFVPVGTADQPLLNPNYQAIYTGTPGHFHNRHSNSTRASIINLSVSDQSATSFQINASRTNVFGEVWLTNVNRAIVPIYDYESPDNEYTPAPSYSPSPDPSDSDSNRPNETQLNIPQFSYLSDNIVAYPRSTLRIAWIAKGV